MANSNTINEVYGKEMHGQIILKNQIMGPWTLGPQTTPKQTVTGNQG